MSVLPDAVLQNPACGVCGDETRHEDDDFACEDCQLIFDGLTLEASFLDPDQPVCGSPCDNYWHGPDKIKVGTVYDCGTCLLPKGHKSMCWRGCKSREATR